MNVGVVLTDRAGGKRIGIRPERNVGATFFTGIDPLTGLISDAVRFV